VYGKKKKGGTVKAGEYNFFNGKETKIINLEQDFCTTQNSVRIVSDRKPYIVMTGRWCNIIFLNVHAPSEVKSTDSKDSFNEELEQPNYLMKILLGDFNLGRENVLKPSFGNERLHKDSNDNGVRNANFGT